MKKKPHQRSSAEMDALRVRALLGDALDDLPDSTREWVFRSLMKRVRWSQVVLACGLTPDAIEIQFQVVQARYQARLDAYKAAHPSQAGYPSG